MNTISGFTNSDSIRIPLAFGAALGLLTTLAWRTFIPFDVMTVVALLLVTGVTLGVWGEDQWSAIGWVFVGAGFVIRVLLPPHIGL